MFTALGTIINALIDTALVSKCLGVRGIAALNLCMPVYLFICMMGMLFSTGAVTLSARAAGRNELWGSYSCLYCAAFFPTEIWKYQDLSMIMSL